MTETTASRIPDRPPTGDRPSPLAGLGNVIGQLAGFWRAQPRGRRLLAVLVILVVGAGVGWNTLSPGGPQWADAVPGASVEDTGELASLLASRGIRYRVVGARIDVPADRVAEARAIAAAAGLPRAGAGLELFDHPSLGQSAFAEQVNFRRALQGELARSITGMAQIEGARVHLAMGRRSVFKDSDQPPSASVALRLHAGQLLSGDQIRGIREMVAASVDGLRPDGVVIVDNHGTPLDGTRPGGDDPRAEVERAIADRVRRMLERVVGAGKVAVVATADVDTSKVSETEEIYDPERTALRSEARTVDGGDATTTTGGVAGVRGNLPGAGAPSSGGGTTSGHLQETRNFEVTRIVRQTQLPEARVRRVQLAVLVDYKAGPDGTAIARTPDELAELGALVREAAGFDDHRGDRIEVRSIPFVAPVEPPPIAIAPGPQTPWIRYAIAGSAAFVVLVVVAIMLLRRRGRATAPIIALPAPVAELERALTGSASAAIAALPGKSAQERAVDAVRADTARSATVLAGWLSEAPPAKAARA